MLVRISQAADVAEGHMRAFDVAGTKVNVSNARGHLFAFDDTCTHERRREDHVAANRLHGSIAALVGAAERYLHQTTFRAPHPPHQALPAPVGLAA